jgi:hypothetical protein
MASTTAAIIADLQQQFEALVGMTTGSASQRMTAAAMEQDLLAALLALGRRLLDLFFTSRAAVRPADPRLPDGARLPSHGRRPRRYVSIFGELTLRRHGFSVPGHALIFPLDRELALPAGCYSALLREWASYGTSDAAYREVQTLLARILGQTLSVQALETMLSQDAVDLAAFDQQPAPTSAAPGVAACPDAVATLLVVQADGKGVPLVLPDTPPRGVRPPRGRPANQMKEAIVTAHYAIAPWVRTPHDLVAALLDGAATTHPAPRPQPVGKVLRASLAGKTVAVNDLAARVSRRDQTAIAAWVALTDGATALQEEMQRAFPQATLVLDIIHASEYLWRAAAAICGEGSPARLAWMRTQLTALLSGQTAAVIATLEGAQAAPTCSTVAQEALARTLRYYRRNQAYMHYDQYLARGWPIGTGVVEGACGHLVKDRLQQAGMRWTIAGAQAMLDLRGIRLSGQWEAYWALHRQQEQQRLYGAQATSAPRLDTEPCVLPLAA